MEENIGMLVEKEIRHDESFYRAIFSPIHYSINDRKIKREALLPPKGRCDVSMFRVKYISMEECIDNACNIQMKGQNFCVVATVSNRDIAHNNRTFSKDKISATVVYSPMHKDKYVDKSIDVYTCDPNIDKPSHVDLTYSELMSDDSDVKTKMRKYAHSLVKTMKHAYNKYS